MLSTILNRNDRNPDHTSGKIVCIVGPTATGKTARAVDVAKQVDGILISADSRQVYRGMDIVTGKDHPEGVKIWGIDIADPNEECSVSTWHNAIQPALSMGRPVIVVGGTGLYIRAITDGIGTMKIPPSPRLRHELEQLSIDDLQVRLESCNPGKFLFMNNSDRHNPRRLIRAIEVALSPYHETRIETVSQSLVIGLEPPSGDSYRKIITNRVLERIAAGAIEETRNLLKTYSSTLPSMTAIGYRSIIDFIDGKIAKEEMIERWVIDEMNYAKRQMTWFRKVPGVEWRMATDAANPAWIAECVKGWYDKE